MYEKYAELRDKMGLKDADVARLSGIGHSTFSDWKNGRSVPKSEKLKKIAAALGADLGYFTKSDSDEAYYVDAEAKELAQFLFENPEYRVLFDASRKVKKEDIDFVKDMIDRMAK